MEIKRRSDLIVLLLLVLLASHDEVERVTARTSCESKSHHFKGPCVSDQNCGSVCHGEGFTGGLCRGFRRRCFCTRHWSGVAVCSL